MDKKLYSTIKRMNYVLKKHITSFDETSWLTGHRYNDMEITILNACFSAGRLTSHGFKPCEDYKKILELAKSGDILTRHKKHTLTCNDIINTGLVQFIKCNHDEQQPEKEPEEQQQPEATEQKEEQKPKKQPAKKTAAKAS